MPKLIFVTILVLFGINSCGGNAENLSVGDKAPEFTLEDHNGNAYSLSDHKGSAPVVVYFYPKANTSGCTKQACGVRDDYSKFTDNGIVIYGISVDDKEDIATFVQENNLNFPLLSDATKEVSEKYGVLNNAGLSSRITFVIDKSGNIAHIIRDVDVDSHAQQVFELSQKLI